ncbi:hypothetical protein KIN20_033962 [Parelaphostrongylus tenuis]|uniref:Uncharacterized protein n=1 Tax=Parelaphostrongylus tenuis TaxID=148309 RepID=A0AAD5WIU1_PARTN|nr:hypothetical protein KIN20_033476 [Parelaphostrongylus tenuis]KAJ1371921.1 hypothetical protein KIN20_033962 [Parelaphostrongylus tenuis]
MKRKEDEVQAVVEGEKATLATNLSTTALTWALGMEKKVEEKVVKDIKSSEKMSWKRREKRMAEAGNDPEGEELGQGRCRRRKEAAERKSAAKLSKKQFNKIKSQAFLSSNENSSDGAPVHTPENSGADSARPSKIADLENSEDSVPLRRRKKNVMDSDDEQSESASPSRKKEVRSSDKSD